MISLKTVAFTAALLVVAISSASAGGPSCIDVTLPNILNMGQCLKLPQDLCHGDGRVVDHVEAIFTCAVKGIARLDVGSQLFLLEGIITEVFNRLDLGSLVDRIFALCKSVGGVLATLSPFGDCSSLRVSGEITCDKPIVLEFPSAMYIRQCVGTTAEVCVGTHPNQAEVIQQLFNTLTCIFTSVLTNSTADASTGILCAGLNFTVELLKTGPANIVGSLLSSLQAATLGKC